MAADPKDPKAKKLIDELGELRQLRGTWDALWRDVEELVVPMRTSETESTLRQTPGTERRRRIFDSTAIFANEQLAAVFAAQLINPAMKWLNFQMRDEDLNQLEEVVRWLSDSRERVLNVLNTPESRFHLAAHEFFLDLGGYGTSVLMVNEAPGPTSPVVFNSWPILSVFIQENAKGMVDTIFITFMWSAKQAVEFYGIENVSTKVKNDFERRPHVKSEFLHVIRPRFVRDTQKPTATNMPVESIHVDIQAGKILRESGFQEMPAVVSRLTKLSGETYGRGPGINMISDIRMLQRVMEVSIRGAQKGIAPPLQAPDDGVIGPIRTSPDAVNFIRPPMERNFIRPIEFGSDVRLGFEFISTLRATILRGFFLDPAELAPPEPRVTATAILDRRDERFRRMTPLVERLQTEFLAPLITRVLGIMARKGLLLQPPPILEGRQFDIKFSSPAAQAQQLTEADNMTRFLQRIIPMLEIDPDAVVNLKADDYIRLMARVTGVPLEIIEAENEVVEKREALAKSRADQVQANELAQAAEATKNLQDVLNAEQAQ